MRETSMTVLLFSICGVIPEFLFSRGSGRGPGMAESVCQAVRQPSQHFDRSLKKKKIGWISRNLVQTFMSPAGCTVTTLMIV